MPCSVNRERLNGSRLKLIIIIYFFTEPWHLPGGQVIEPNGKSYTMTMVTVGKAKDGELTEEMIIYDMSSMMRQLGLANQ